MKTRPITALTALALLALTACGSDSIQAGPSPLRTTVPAPTQHTPSAGESSEGQGPYISAEDQQKGIEEGNNYVIYAQVMCFGGNLVTPEEYEKIYNASTDPYTPEEQAEQYAAIPQEIKDQSELNGTVPYEVPQECLDAGWQNVGAI